VNDRNGWDAAPDYAYGHWSWLQGTFIQGYGQSAQQDRWHRQNLRDVANNVKAGAPGGAPTVLESTLALLARDAVNASMEAQV